MSSFLLNSIKVFGDKAREIEDGQLFRAIKSSVEGHDVVILEPCVTIDRDGCPSYEVKYE